MSAGQLLEEAHRAGAGALGRVAVMLATRRVSKEGVRAILEGLKEAIRVLEEIPHK